MCEGLRKVSQRVARLGMDFLSEEIDIVGTLKHRRKDAMGFFQISAARQEICFPKTTRRGTSTPP